MVLGIFLLPVLRIQSASPIGLFNNAPSPLEAAITFDDFRPKSGLDFILNNSVTSRKYSIETMAGSVALFDFNNDGRMDIVVTSLNSSPQLFKNNTRDGDHWLLLQLVGVESNRDGLGTQVKITTVSGFQHYQAVTAVGYNSSSDKRVHFGLGKVSKVDRIEIQWPSGIHQVLTDIKADQILVVKEQGDPWVPLKKAK